MRYITDVFQLQEDETPHTAFVMYVRLLFLWREIRAASMNSFCGTM
jgi:hypothetical protein